MGDERGGLAVPGLDIDLAVDHGRVFMVVIPEVSRR
jgi:hypothetical protein